MDKENKEQNKIKELEQKILELEENWKRALADYINLEKRTQEDKVRTIEYANETLLRKFLPVLDHLEMMKMHIEDHGLGLIIQEFQQVLQSSNVREVETVGKEYNHETMEAIEMVAGEKNVVVEEISKGYFLNEKLLRPAKVKVGLGESSKEE